MTSAFRLPASRWTTLFTVLWLSTLVLYAAAPWVVGSGASLTANAYDLAEWASLHPSAHAETPALLTPLLLRLPLVCLGLLMGFAGEAIFGADKRDMGAVMRTAAVLALGVAMLPPPEFLDNPDDLNYRQQFVLALLTLIGGLFGLSGRLAFLRRPIALGIALIGAMAALTGLLRGLALMQEFGLASAPGLGGPGTIALLLAAGVWIGVGWAKQ